MIFTREEVAKFAAKFEAGEGTVLEGLKYLQGYLEENKGFVFNSYLNSRFYQRLTASQSQEEFV